MFGLQPSFAGLQLYSKISRTNKIDSGPAKVCLSSMTRSSFSTFLSSPLSLQKGGVPAAPSGTATLLRLSPSHRFYPKQRLSATAFRSSQLPWLDGRSVEGPGTYSPQHC